MTAMCLTRPDRGQMIELVDRHTAALTAIGAWIDMNAPPPKRAKLTAEPDKPEEPGPVEEKPEPGQKDTVPLDQIILNKPYWVVYYGGTKYKGMWRQVQFTQRPTEGDNWHIRNSNGRGPITTWVTGNIGRVQVEQPSEEELGQQQPR